MLQPTVVHTNHIAAGTPFAGTLNVVKICENAFVCAFVFDEPSFNRGPRLTPWVTNVFHTEEAAMANFDIKWEDMVRAMMAAAHLIVFSSPAPDGPALDA